MIKFFRKFRLKLLSTNKVGKYLLYACGEIILVVIGILIALQINNWNQNRQSDQEELKVLSNLKHEFQSSIKELKQKNAQRESIQQGNYLLTDMIQNKDYSNIELIDTLLSRFTLTPTYNGKTGALDLIINSGKFNLLKNDTLKKELLAWPLKVEDITEEEVIYKNIIWEEFIPFLRSFIKLNKISGTTGSQISSRIAKRAGSMPDDYEGLFSNPEFENFLYESEFFMIIGMVGSENLISLAEQILFLIENELEK